MIDGNLHVDIQAVVEARWRADPDWRQHSWGWAVPISIWQGVSSLPTSILQRGEIDYLVINLPVLNGGAGISLW